MGSEQPNARADLIVAQAAAHYGTTISPARAEAMATEVRRLVGTVNEAMDSMSIDIDPAHFVRFLVDRSR